MSLTAINQALQTQLEQVPDLRVFTYVPDSGSPPAALIDTPRDRVNPTDMLLHNGAEVTMWRYRVPVLLVLGRISERDFADKYDLYVSELCRVLPQADVCHAHIARVSKPRQVTWAGAEYEAVDIDVEVWGS